MKIIMLIIILVIVLSLYFMPTVIAYAKNVSTKKRILKLNIILGWTFIGWIVALDKALTDDDK